MRTPPNIKYDDLARQESSRVARDKFFGFLAVAACKNRHHRDKDLNHFDCRGKDCQECSFWSAETLMEYTLQYLEEET